jgi:prepilin-type processing-associated H-X9-DG protein
VGGAGNLLLWQSQPNPWQTVCNSYLASSGHSNGMNVCMADGSVRNVSTQVSPLTFWYACTPNGNDVLGSDW